MADYRTKKTRRRSATALVSLVSDGHEDTVPKAECFFCRKMKKIICADSDPEWELPGHPDRIDRNVCIDCLTELRSRYDCCGLVYDAMRKKLKKKKLSDYEISRAVKTAWRSFSVDYNDDELIKMSRKLKIKHGWLDANRPK